MLLYVMSLDCHELTSYMAHLYPATDIATKLSPNKYWSSPNKYWSSRGILLLLMILIRLSVLLTSMRKYKNKEKCNTQILIYELSDNLPSLSRNKLSMSDCSWMAIAILVPVIL